MKQQDKFSSKLGAIAVAAGSAVGLGNIWRFPYILGENGGAAFLLIYILFTIIIALPVLISEFSIGRMAGLSATAAFKKLAPGKKWYFIGLSGVLCAFVIISFYNVVAGWTLYYTYLAIVGDLQSLNEQEVTQLYQQTSSDTTTCIFWMVLIVGAIAYIVARGVQDGIEKYSKVLMPLLFLLMIVLCVRSVTLDNASEGLAFLLNPDFSKLTPTAIFAALGQAFFSLSIGMGVMITYGSYINKAQNIQRSAMSIVVIDFIVALLAGIMIFPCAFSFGISPDSGPGLVFVTLPNIFNKMTAGHIMSIAFFLLLAIAALTSSISLFEVLVSFAKAQYGIGRRKATIIASVLTVCVGIICAVSPTVFSLFDNVSANILLPLGAFFIVLFIPIVLGRKRLRKELEANGDKCKTFSLLYFLIKFIVPLAIFSLFLYCIVNWLFVN
ncbi:MAG: sodium-dependent transporter [Bacteroidales bacterium]|nr:sodium-dependent transporter [Bacteroidales bacterium]